MVPEQRHSTAEQLHDIYRCLFAAYGPQGWWPGADDPFEVIVGAILTQNVAWSNVEKALENLRAAGALSPGGLLALRADELAELVRPAGYFTVKAQRLRAFARMVVDDFDGDLERLLRPPLAELRTRLLATHGIGPETADDIILYAAGQPSFVVDAYTTRLFTRLGLTPGASHSRAGRATVADTRWPYDAWRELFMGHLPPDEALFNEYHALIVRHGVERCRKRGPRCADCPLLDRCPAGRSAIGVLTTG